MKKSIGRVFLCLLLAVFIWCGALLGDRRKLNEELIRLHVVANSDSEQDQDIKLRVRDAVVSSLQEDLSQLSDVQEARAYLQDNLPRIQKTAEAVLKQAGLDSSCVVTLCREAFDVRHYDTFSLPSGVYESLRIVIGEGAGRNWWCVAFPALCLPTTSDVFEAVAAGAGFSELLCKTLSAEDDREIRFLLLDLLGKLENSLLAG